MASSSLETIAMSAQFGRGVEIIGQDGEGVSRYWESEESSIYGSLHATVEAKRGRGTEAEDGP